MLTGAPDYPEQLQRLFERTPVHLLAGERGTSWPGAGLPAI